MNKSKVAGTNEEKEVHMLLMELDPDGEWERRTAGKDGKPRGAGGALTHGFDVWSVKRKCWCEIKMRDCRITQKMIAGWLKQHHSEELGVVVFREKWRSDRWVAIGNVWGDMCYELQPFEQFFERLSYE